MVCLTMNRIRRHRWRTPLSLLAMLALVWAQLALVTHPACAISAMSLSLEPAHHAQHTPADQNLPPCHGAPVSDDAAMCASHCNQGDLSKDPPRLLSVPTLGQVPLMPVLAQLRLPDAAPAVAARPRAAWHRPTRHPASLLLI